MPKKIPMKNSATKEFVGFMLKKTIARKVRQAAARRNLENRRKGLDVRKVRHSDIVAEALADYL